MLFKEKNSNNFSFNFSENYLLKMYIEGDKVECVLSTKNFKLKKRVFKFENLYILELIKEKNYSLSFIIAKMKEQIEFVSKRLNKLDY